MLVIYFLNKWVKVQFFDQKRGIFKYLGINIISKSHFSLTFTYFVTLSMWLYSSREVLPHLLIIRGLGVLKCIYFRWFYAKIELTLRYDHLKVIEICSIRSARRFYPKYHKPFLQFVPKDLQIHVFSILGWIMMSKRLPWKRHDFSYQLLRPILCHQDYQSQRSPETKNVIC